MSVRRRLLLLASLLGCAGCYTFEPASMQSLRPGMNLRARLSESGEQSVADLTGNANRDTVDGRLLRTDSETLVLSVWRTDVIGASFAPGRLELPLQRDHVVELERRRLSYLRTGGVVTGVAAGLYLLVRLAWGDAGGFLPGFGGGDEI